MEFTDRKITDSLLFSSKHSSIIFLKFDSSIFFGYKLVEIPQLLSMIELSTFASLKKWLVVLTSGK